MKVLKFGKDIKTVKCECDNCNSIFLYTEHDVETYYGEWERTGVESSKRYGFKYIICPVCNKSIVLESLTDEY